MAHKSILIIGAGLAGLSAGCYAQMNGYKSHIFEHHNSPGGVVATWKRKDYIFDGGVHFWTGPLSSQSSFVVYDELGIRKMNRFLPLSRYCDFMEEASGAVVCVTSDMDRLASDFRAMSARDWVVIKGLFEAVRSMQKKPLSTIGFGRPPELQTFFGKIREFWLMRGVLNYFSGSYSKPMSEFALAIKNPWLRQVIENLFLPEVPVWFVAMLLAMFADGDLALLEGPSSDVPRSIETRHTELGGTITYEAKVDQILVENDRVVGIQLSDGTEHKGDIVISAADGYNTIFGMLGGRYVSSGIVHRYRNWPLVRGAVLVTFGVNRKSGHEPWLKAIKLKEPLEVGGSRVEAVLLRGFDHSVKFAPEGKSVVQVSFDTDSEYWFELRKDAGVYEAEKKRIAADLLRWAESYYPGISNQVEALDVATPYTTWRYTLNRKGAYMGWMPTEEVLMGRVEKTLPGLENFYMAGQWAMPGGGVLSSLYSGRHVIQILCSKEGRRFTTTVA